MTDENVFLAGFPLTNFVAPVHGMLLNIYLTSTGLPRRGPKGAICPGPPVKRGPQIGKNRTFLKNRPIALTSQILRVSSRCSLTISVRVQQPHTAQELTILMQNNYKRLQNLLCLQKLYHA
jgi:hypothetical protein